MFLRSPVFLDGSETLINTAMERIFTKDAKLLHTQSILRSRHSDSSRATNVPMRARPLYRKSVSSNSSWMRPHCVAYWSASQR